MTQRTFELKNASCPSPAQQAYFKSLTSKTHFKTELQPYQDHNGWRPGNLHLFIGTAGGGKSSTMFQILIDLVKCNTEFFEAQKVLIYLSEETTDTFKANMINIGLTSDNAQKFLEKVLLISEPEIKNKYCKDTLTPQEIENIIQLACRENNVGFFILDNLTTTDPYLEDRHNEISLLAKRLQHACRDLVIPFLIFAHTRGDVNEPGFSMEDIRQKKTITLLTEFCYLIHRFSSTRANSYLQIVKHRGYPVKDWFYELAYNYDLGIVDKMRKADRDEFKERLKEYRGRR